MLSSPTMRTGPRLLLVAAALLVTSTWLTARRAEHTTTQTPVARSAAPAPPPEGDYLGSRACQACHRDAYERWESSLDIQMTRPVAEAAVLGDFSRAARLNAHGRSYAFGMRQGKPFVTVRAEGRAEETYQVDCTLGAKRFQGYLSTLPDGRMYVLPVFRRRARHAADLERELLQLPRHQSRPRVHRRHQVVSHRVDRARHRLRGVPRPRPSARGPGPDLGT